MYCCAAARSGLTLSGEAETDSFGSMVEHAQLRLVILTACLFYAFEHILDAYLVRGNLRLATYPELQTDPEDKNLVILQSLICLLREKNVLTRADIEELCETVKRRANNHDERSTALPGYRRACGRCHGSGADRRLYRPQIRRKASPLDLSVRVRARVGAVKHSRLTRLALDQVTAPASSRSGRYTREVEQVSSSTLLRPGVLRWTC